MKQPSGKQADVDKFSKMNRKDFEGRHIAFTGSRGAMIAGERYFWRKWKKFVIEVISQYVGSDYWWHVGDCPKGVDGIIVQYSGAMYTTPKLKKQPHISIYKTIPTGEGKGKKRKFQPQDFATRSMKMVSTVSKLPNSVLIAFPDKPCPDGVSPEKPGGGGSGTWLTIAAAKKKGIDTLVYPLPDCNVELPEWLAEKNLSLSS